MVVDPPWPGSVRPRHGLQPTDVTVRHVSIFPSDAPAAPYEPGFDRLIRTSAVGFWHIGVDGLSRYLNPAMCRLLEIDAPDRIAGMTYHRFFTARSLEVMRKEHQKRATGAASTYEAELIGMGGGHSNVMISGSPMMTDGGVLDGMIGTFTDITGMRQAEAQVRERDQRLRSLFAASMDAVGVSCAGTHVLVNPAYLQLFGFTHADELVGTSILDLIAADERPLVLARIRQRTEGRPASSHYETRGRRRDGSEFPLEASVSSYYEGETVFTVAILRDITVRQRLEEQVHQVQKMDAIGLMAGGLAHDFNNLLTVIIGCSERLAQRLGNDKVGTASAVMINTTAQRAAALTRQLLTISRKEVITPQPIDLAALLVELAPMRQEMVGAQVDLGIDAPQATPPILGDLQQMHQVVTNLCLNARDAMPAGGRLLIALTSLPMPDGGQSGPAVELAVSDTGTGMAPAVQARIFEPFFTTKGIGKGTGLGLSTVYSIVRQAGGSITVRSAPGEGSSFRILFPVAPLGMSPTPNGASIPRSSSTPPQQQQQQQQQQQLFQHDILVVDDEETIRTLVRDCLEDAGHLVSAYATPREALDHLRAAAKTPDLVISDVMMPGMTGWEFARTLDQLHPGRCLLFISGFSPDGMPPHLVQRPRTRFLAKPFTPTQFIAAVRELMEPELA